MDPNATLAEALEAMAKFRAQYEDGTADDAMDAAIDLADAFAALVEWLAKGGFAPDWKAGK